MRTNIINEDTFVYKNNIYVWGQILFVRTIIIIMRTQSMYVHTNYNDEDKHYWRKQKLDQSVLVISLGVEVLHIYHYQQKVSYKC